MNRKAIAAIQIFLLSLRFHYNRYAMLQGRANFFMDVTGFSKYQKSNLTPEPLTCRPVGDEEGLSMGLANRTVEKGKSREEAETLAVTLADFPQVCIRSDREAVYGGMELDDALEMYFKLGMRIITGGEAVEGAKRFSRGTGRHEKF